MEKGIKAGDLVMVVRPVRCGCKSEQLGVVFRATEIIPAQKYAGRKWKCPTCPSHGIYQSTATGYFVAGCPVGNSSPGVARGRLLKIGPPADDETTEQPEEISA